MNIAAFDIGGTNIRYVVGNSEGEFLVEPSSRETGEDIGRQVASILEQLEKSEHLIDAVSIVTAGPPNHEEKSVKRIVTLDRGTVEDIQFGEAVASTGFDPEDLYFENDAYAAALGEYLFGVGSDRGVEDLVYLTFSTGIGAGAIQDGEMHHGSTGNAGKAGAYPLAPEYQSITDKTEGCWGQLCSGNGIPHYVDHLLIDEERETVLKEFDWVSAKDLYSAAQAGDEVAKEFVWEKIGRLNARGIGIIALSFDPEIITIGGSIVLNNPKLVLGPIREYFPRNYVAKYGYPSIELTGLGHDIELRGALALPAYRETG